MNVQHSLATYQAVKVRLREVEQDIDEHTLADTVEGLTDLHEILATTVRSALDDEALADGLRVRIKDMQERVKRFETRAITRRSICRDAMQAAELKKIVAEDVTISLRPGVPGLCITDEKLIPEKYWEPQPARLKRQDLIKDLKNDQGVSGAELIDSEAILSVRSK